ncbi:hypothetical protein PVAP13_9KG466092 [Panicum virgatum]|uniref:Uncharacterized protein n=1 Tax=Panicum virgatum TaxID=38727 RepID=A0A8T0NCG8_PANVG|nr:hypothetical protein PVAP13_9KG466092 [Panicum virgatum]
MPSLERSTAEAISSLTWHRSTGAPLRRCPVPAANPDDSGQEPRAPPPLESRRAPPLCGSSAAACRERSSNQAGSSTTAPPLRSPRGELSPPSAPVAASPATRGSVAARSYRPAAPRPAAHWFCRGKGSVAWRGRG